MENKGYKKYILYGLAFVFIPGSSIIALGYLLAKSLKKVQTEDLVQSGQSSDTINRDQYDL
jgi:hypothetical protein